MNASKERNKINGVKRDTNAANVISPLCCTTACTLEKSITNSFESVHTVPVHDSSDISHGTTEQPEQTDAVTVHVHDTSNDTPFVVDRSTSLLTENELSVLDRGLTFVPTECRPDKRRLVKEFDEFTRLLRVKF